MKCRLLAKWLRTRLTVLGPGLTLLFSAVATAAAPVTVAVIPQQVSEHVWFVQGLSGMVSLSNEGFNSNAAFVVTDEGVVVFDALGTPALGAELRRPSDCCHPTTPPNCAGRSDSSPISRSSKSSSRTITPTIFMACRLSSRTSRKFWPINSSPSICKPRHRLPA